MGNKYVSFFGLLLSTARAVAGVGESGLQGRELHNQHCLACHDTSVYTRENRFVGSLAELEAQVTRCAAGPANVAWGAAEVKAVTRYMDDQFYHF